MYSELWQLTRTKEEANRLLGEAEALEAGLFRTNPEAWEEVMKTKVRLKVAQVLNQRLPQDAEGRQKVLRELKKELVELPVARLTLAVEPTEKMVQEISDKLRKEVAAGIIVDIERDALIVGGALVTYGGKFGDFSLATRMEKVWAKQAETLLRMAYGGN